MKELRFLLLLVLLSGCGKHEEPVPAPAIPASPSRERLPVTPPSAQTDLPTPASPSPLAKSPQSPVANAQAIQDALQKFQAATHDVNERITIVSDVATLADEGAPKREIAATLSQMFRTEATAEVKSAILDELGFLGDPAAFEPLAAGLEQQQPEEVRDSASSAMEDLLDDLGQQEDDASFNTIVRALDSRYPPDVREAAINALEERHDPRGVNYLQALVNDPNQDIREAATDAVESLKQ